MDIGKYLKMPKLQMQLDRVDLWRYGRNPYTYKPYNHLGQGTY